LIIDTETGGLDPKTGLIQVGSIVLDHNFEPIDTFVCVIKPPKNQPISKFSQKITNLDTQKINSGVTYKKFCQIYLSFLQKNFGKHSAVCVGHFFPFDYARIVSVFSHCGLFSQVSKYITNIYIDTKVVALYQNLKAEQNNTEVPFPVLSLSNPGGLKEKLNLNFESHDALGDCWGTYHVLKKLLQIGL
jgi:DNA polymerase III epsilon subunit-like protein